MTSAVNASATMPWERRPRTSTTMATPQASCSAAGSYSPWDAGAAEKTTAQGKLTPHEDPVLTIKDLEAKASKLSDAMLELIQKKIRQPKPSSSSSKKSKSKTSKTKKNKSSTSTSATDEAETDAPEAAEESTGPKIVNMDTEHGQMPTEEEVLKILKAMGDNKEEGHDEL